MRVILWIVFVTINKVKWLLIWLVSYFFKIRMCLTVWLVVLGCAKLKWCKSEIKFRVSLWWEAVAPLLVDKNWSEKTWNWLWDKFSHECGCNLYVRLINWFYKVEVVTESPKLFTWFHSYCKCHLLRTLLLFGKTR